MTALRDRDRACVAVFYAWHKNPTTDLLNAHKMLTVPSTDEIIDNTVELWRDWRKVNGIETSN